MAQKTEDWNMDDIRGINKEEFANVLKEWSGQDHIANKFQTQMRKDLFEKFNKTTLGKHVSSENRKFIFEPLELLLNSLVSEFLYGQGNHFTLSVFFSESRYSQCLPNFQRMDQFKFVASEITELLEILGIPKSDKSHKRILSMYIDSNASLLSVFVKFLVNNQKKVSVSNAGTQTKNKEDENLNISPRSNKSRSRKRKRKHHGLSMNEYIKFKPKVRQSSSINLITDNLIKMSGNICKITNKLDQFKESENTDPKKNDSAQEIIQTVGKIVNQLDGCVNHFEKLCADIKISNNDSNDKKFNDWMSDMKNSENGQKFLKKLQKSFTKIVKEEKSKIKRDYRKKLSNEMYKNRKYRAKQDLVIEEKIKNLETKKHEIELTSNLLNKEKVNASPVADAIKISKEINKMFKNTCIAINNIDKECEIFEKALETDLVKENLEIEQSTKNQMQNKFQILGKYEKPKTFSSSSNNITISIENSLSSDPEKNF